MDKNQIKKAIERRGQIEKILEKDDTGLGLLRGLTLCAVNYVETTVNFEAHKTRIHDAERCVDDSTEAMVELDSRKRKSHEALMSRLYSFNRYLFTKYDGEVPIGGIYSLEPPESIKDRHSVGDWGGYYVFGIKNGGKEDLK